MIIQDLPRKPLTGRAFPRKESRIASGVWRLTSRDVIRVVAQTSSLRRCDVREAEKQIVINERFLYIPF